MNRLLLPGLLVLLVLVSVVLVGCGDDTPTPGGGLTPYVVLITPTPDPANMTIAAKKTVTAQVISTTVAAKNNAGASVAATTSNNAVTTNAATTSTGLNGNTYTVQKGDTLNAIADKLGVDVPSIIKLNNIKDADTLQIGQQLQIPASKPKTPTPTT